MGALPALRITILTLLLIAGSLFDLDRLFPPDPTVRAIARDLFRSVRDLPIVSPHGQLVAAGQSTAGILDGPGITLMAIRRFATLAPEGIARVSGSAPRLPIRMTLLTPRAMAFAPSSKW